MFVKILMIFHFTVVMTNVLDQHKKPIQISKVHECVQAARRIHQFNYQKSVNVPDVASHGDDEDSEQNLLLKRLKTIESFNNR